MSGSTHDFAAAAAATEAAMTLLILLLLPKLGSEGRLHYAATNRQLKCQMSSSMECGVAGCCRRFIAMWLREER